MNAAIAAAAAPWRAHVRVVDAVETFTPDGYRDAIDVRGTGTIVREADGSTSTRPAPGCSPTTSWSDSVATSCTNPDVDPPRRRTRIAG